MPKTDWRLIKSMCYQESRFVVDAVSPVGAIGVCQVMPKTFVWITDRVGMNGVDIYSARDNIFAGVAYLSWIKSEWTVKRTEWQRMQLSFAGYNAGIGNVLKAQKKCENARLWSKIKTCMVYVTGKNNSKETIDYVGKIERWYEKIGQCKPSSFSTDIVVIDDKFEFEFIINGVIHVFSAIKGKVGGLRGC